LSCRTLNRSAPWRPLCSGCEVADFPGMRGRFVPGVDNIFTTVFITLQQLLCSFYR
jgi:hypothetical protein